MSQCNRLKAVLLEEVVEILTEHLEHEARVTAMAETLKRPDDVERSGVLLTQSQQDRHLDLSLARVRRMVLEYLDRHHVVASVSPTLHHLAERALPKELQHLHATP